MILGALSSGVDWREFIKAVPSLKGTEVAAIEEVHSYLVSGGFVSEDGRLTHLGDVMLQNSISPIAYDEFKRRADEGIDILLTVRPLMYMKRIKGSLRSFLPPEDYYTEISAFKSRFYLSITLHDGSDELWIFTSGRLFEYENVSNPPVRVRSRRGS